MTQFPRLVSIQVYIHAYVWSIIMTPTVWSAARDGFDICTCIYVFSFIAWIFAFRPARCGCVLLPNTYISSRKKESARVPSRCDMLLHTVFTSSSSFFFALASFYAILCTKARVRICNNELDSMGNCESIVFCACCILWRRAQRARARFAEHCAVLSAGTLDCLLFGTSMRLCQTYVGVVVGASHARRHLRLMEIMFCRFPLQRETRSAGSTPYVCTYVCGYSCVHMI